MKEKLSACVSQGQSHLVFNNSSVNDIKKFINALESAKEFIDLTMRDEFLLDQAKYTLKYREA